MKVDLVLRNPDEGDWGFIYKSWLVNLRDSNHLESVIDSKIYFDNHTALIQRILAKSQCILATSPEDTRQIFGFLVYERMRTINVLHYAYVKAPYRRLGIANYLKDFAFEDYEGEFPILSTHYTRMSHILNHSWNLIFNPYLLFDFYGV